jgi:hypothetical protein
MTDPTCYEIRVRGHLPDLWTNWFENLTIENRPDGEAVLFGPISDQAALHGILNRVRDLGLVLVSVRQLGAVPRGSGQPRAHF